VNLRRPFVTHPGAPFAAAACLAALIVAPRIAMAEPPQAPAVVDADDDDEGPGAGTRRPAAPDTRGGHLFVNAKASYLAPAGSLAVTVPTADVTGAGMNFGGILGIGISRYTVVEASFGYAPMFGPSDCKDCGGRIFDLGVGLSYHLAQGVAIDPWVSYGLGLRLADLTTTAVPGQRGGALADQSYRGVDLARLALGADFYPLPQLGFGPFIEVDLGTAFSRPDPTLGPSAYAFFQFGLRIALDPLRSASPPAPSPRVETARRGQGPGSVASEVSPRPAGI